MAVTNASSRRNRQRIERLTSNTTFTVPAGVFSVDVEACGGGAGMAANNNGVAGANTTVAGGGTTITALRAASAPMGSGTTPPRNVQLGNGTPNTGESAKYIGFGINVAARTGGSSQIHDAIPMRRTLATTPGGSLTVTVGAGGSSTGSGGSGYVLIRYTTGG